MRPSRGIGLPRAAVAVAVALVASTAVTLTASDALASARPAHSACAGNPWTSARYQRTRTPDGMAALVLSCLKQTFPATYRHDEIGIVSLNATGWFENFNGLALGSSVQEDLAQLGMPPITLQDGPGGLITKTYPTPTVLPNELALGATFDRSLASLYGAVLGSEAHTMGYDAVQAPDLNLVRVPAWGRAAESFGESPVLAGEMGGAEAAAIEASRVMVVLKHFGPYSQDTDRRILDQVVSARTFDELYARPFTIALRELVPILSVRGHALGMMCAYGDVDQRRSCLTGALAGELSTLGLKALVRSDQDVQVSPAALLEAGVDLIKPLDASLLTPLLANPGVAAALDRAVERVFSTEFAAGLVNGTLTTVRRGQLTTNQVRLGIEHSLQIEQRAAVLLKNVALLPLRHATGQLSVLGDATLPSTCRGLATQLSKSLHTRATCTNDGLGSFPTVGLFTHLLLSQTLASATTTFTAPSTQPYVVTTVTGGDTQIQMDSTTIIDTQGRSELPVQRTALVDLTAGVPHSFEVQWLGAPPTVYITQERAAVDDALRGIQGSKVAVVLAEDQSQEGMDRSSLSLPGAQDAVIEAVAARIPTIVVLATDGAASMPWLGEVRGVLEVWNPTGISQTDRVLSGFVRPWRNLLTGAADPSGRLPMTFPVTASQSPMGVAAFWPGVQTSVNLDLAPGGGVGIGMPWYRQARWPVLFPFGYGLSYTSYALTGGSVSNGPGGLQMIVGVKDTGGTGGTETVQVYADDPTSLGEPNQQLVGFGTLAFNATQAHGAVTKYVAIPLLADALATYAGGAMRVAHASYCLEAATFAGDPVALTTHAVVLAPTRRGVAIAAPAALHRGTCAA